MNSNKNLFDGLKSKDRQRACKSARALRHRMRKGRRARSSMSLYYTDLWSYYDDELDLWEMYLILSLFEELNFYDDVEFDFDYTGHDQWSEWESDQPPELEELRGDFADIGGGEIDDGEISDEWTKDDSNVEDAEAEEVDDTDRGEDPSEQALEDFADESEGGDGDVTVEGDGS